ncbi:MAG: hypothetical protein IPO90_08985 [Flavobacteriales bacterium]|nr:hypothetical protein [Flavobacteriales bacterium]
MALSDQATDISNTSDGGFVLYGSGGFSFNLGLPSDHYLLKIDNAGDTLWTKRYGGTGFDGGFSAEETSDGGYILLGATTSFGGNKYEVIRTNADGTVLWSNILDGEGGADEGYEIRRPRLCVPDNGNVPSCEMDALATRRGPTPQAKALVSN